MLGSHILKLETSQDNLSIECQVVAAGLALGSIGPSVSACACSSATCLPPKLHHAECFSSSSINLSRLFIIIKLHLASQVPCAKATIQPWYQNSTTRR